MLKKIKLLSVLPCLLPPIVNPIYLSPSPETRSYLEQIICCPSIPIAQFYEASKTQQLEHLPWCLPFGSLCVECSVCALV
ncbi:hypothetical protein QBC43DRAFT_317153 [Cladorrhinum sp. PSN259]|nr:hypothetical protein QBC43DRAFT_317153 [Cladorrhinum sp. PSN259]